MEALACDGQQEISGDKIEDSIQFLRTLQRLEAFVKGSTFALLPIDETFEYLVDLTTHLSKIIAEGCSSSLNNSGLKFSEDFRDDLGNPLQIKIVYPSRKWFASRQLSEYLSDFGEAIVLFKQGYDFFRDSQKVVENCSNIAALKSFIKDLRGDLATANRWSKVLQERNTSFIKKISKFRDSNTKLIKANSILKARLKKRSKNGNKGHNKHPKKIKKSTKLN